MKTAQELGLTEGQHRALVLVLEHFKSGEVKHSSTDACTPSSVTFNMREWNSNYTECGTMMCIGGYAEYLTNGQDLFFLIDDEEETEEYRNLCDLFLGREDGCYSVRIHGGRHSFLYEITVEQATRALENYLNTGKPCWREVLFGGPK